MPSHTRRALVCARPLGLAALAGGALLLACSAAPSLGTPDPGATSSSSGASGTSGASGSSGTSGGSSSGGSSSGGSSSGGSSSGGSSSGGSGSSGAIGDGGTTSKLTTVFTVLMENHDYAEIVGSANAPYFNSLIAKYGLATNYMDSMVHPSLPNYLYLISGDTQGVTTDFDPTTNGFPKNAQHLGSQLIAKSVPWRSYQESMGTACKLTVSGNYAPKHNPFLYFTDIQSGPCAATNVDYSQLAADLTANANHYYFITPNQVDDGHNGTPGPALKVSDTWAQTEIGKIMASPAYLNGGVIFITWDEAEGRNGDSRDQVPMIVVSEQIKSPGFKSNKAYSHKSYLATVEDILGLGRLATTTNEPNMMEFFK